MVDLELINVYGYLVTTCKWHSDIRLVPIDKLLLPALLPQMGGRRAPSTLFCSSATMKQAAATGKIAVAQ